MPRFPMPMAIVTAVTGGLLAATGVFAHGFFGGMMGQSGLPPEQWAARQKKQFETVAQMLGVGIQEVTAAWAAGKTLEQFAGEKGITQAQLSERMQTARADAYRAQLKVLVDQGVITQAQADLRWQTSQQAIPKNSAKGMMKHGKFFRHWGW